MTRPPEADAPHDAAGPPVLRLERAAGRIVRLSTLVADVLRAVDPVRSCGADGTPPVRIECDVDDTVTVEEHATGVRRLLESLVRHAVAAAARPDPDAATPPLREVVITAVDTGLLDPVTATVDTAGPYPIVAGGVRRFKAGIV